MTSAVDRSGPILLFDGVCNLCTGAVRFVIEKDTRKRFRFASLQSPAAARLMGPTATGGDQLETMILVEGGRIHRKSTAALLTAWRLDGLWPLLAVLLAVPRPIRNMAYDWIGRRRYRLFGKRDACWTPDDDVADRFLD